MMIMSGILANQKRRNIFEWITIGIINKMYKTAVAKLL